MENVVPLEQVVNPWGAATLEGLDTANVEGGSRISGKSRRQRVVFYNKKVAEPVTDKFRIIEKTGEVKILSTKMVTVQREYVQITTPGDKNEINNPSTDWHRREYWLEYQAFRDGKGVPIGKDLDECAYIPSGVVTELKYVGVHTEEQLADASDLLCDRVPHGHEMRAFAKTVCEANAKETSETTRIRAELARTQMLVAALEAQFQAAGLTLVDARGEPIRSVERAPVDADQVKEAPKAAAGTRGRKKRTAIN